MFVCTSSTADDGFGNTLRVLRLHIEDICQITDL